MLIQSNCCFVNFFSLFPNLNSIFSPPLIFFTKLGKFLLYLSLIVLCAMDLWVWNLTIQVPIPQNGQIHSNNLSAICWQIVLVCLTILWDWRLMGLTYFSFFCEQLEKISLLLLLCSFSRYLDKLVETVSKNLNSK